MTTVVAVEHKDGSITFASDSRVSGWTVNDGWVDKVVQNGRITFAAAGYLRAIQVMAFAKLAEAPDSRDPQVVDRYVALELIPAIIEAFEDIKNEDARKGSEFLVAVNGRVYQVSGDGSWLRSKRGIYGLGSGMMYAIGALEAGADPVKAVKIASRYDSYTNSDVREMVLAAPEVSA